MVIVSESTTSGAPPHPHNRPKMNHVCSHIRGTNPRTRQAVPRRFCNGLSTCVRSFFLTLIGLAFVAPAFGETIDRIVAVVEEEVVLWSEVQLEAELAKYAPASSPFWSTDRTDPASRLIEAAILRQLASDVALYEPPEDQVREQAEAVRMQFPDRPTWLAFLATYGLDEVSLRTRIRRRLVVDRYLSRNLDVPTDDPQRWLIAFEPLMEQVRTRSRVRVVEPQQP